MKTASDPRHQIRRHLIQALFSYSINSQTKQNDSELQDIINQLDLIDTEISKNAPEWPITNINRIDLAILRLGTYEVIFKAKVPDKVIIDEAIELSKEFGSENTPAFINAVLAKIVVSRSK